MKRIALVLLAALSLCISAPAQTPLFHQYEHVLGTIEPFSGDVQNVSVPKFNPTGKTLQYVEFVVDTYHYKFTNVDNRSCTTSSSTWFGNDPNHTGDAKCNSVLTYQVPSGSFLYDSAITYPVIYKTLPISTSDYYPQDVGLYGITTRFTSSSKWSGMTGTSGDWTLVLTHDYSGGYGDTVNGGTNYTGTLAVFGWPAPYTGGCQETRYVVDADFIDWDVYVNYTYTVP